MSELKNKNSLDAIEDAIADIAQGKIVIVVDDEDRENEGDFIAAAETITPEIINFMSKYGRGLICAPIIEDRCDELELPLMVKENTVLHHTAFTVSVDLKNNGCSTGISATDRAKTIQALNHLGSTPDDFRKPGHMFPLKARSEGVLARPGHTEATVDLVRLAGFPYPYGGVLVEILNADGSMARLPDLFKIAEKFQLKIISVQDLIEYRKIHDYHHLEAFASILK